MFAAALGLVVVGCEDAKLPQGEASPCESARAPVDTSAPSYVERIFAGGNNVCAVFQGGSMWCWGDNAYGQIGDGTLVGGGYPKRTNDLPGVLRVGFGSAHICAVVRDGCVWCWGDGSRGELGPGKSGSRLPVLFEGLYDAREIATGSSANVVLRETGELRWWGQPELVDGTDAPASWTLGAMYSTITLGFRFACGLRYDGLVDCWGANEHGQLGTGDNMVREEPSTVVGLSDVGQLSSGAFASCALRADRSVWCWGRNSTGTLGDGTTLDRNAPSAVPLADVEEVAVAGHACARTTSGQVWCWGRNESNQVGNGATVDAVVNPWEIGVFDGARALAVSSDFSCVLAKERDIWCWGYGQLGALGDGTLGNSSTPVQVVWDPTAP